MALGQRPPESTPPGALAVCFRGQVKAYVTRDSWQPVGAFAELDSEDPEYRLVALMSVYAQHVLIASEGVYTEQDAIAYALGELVPHELLERDLPDPSHTATALCLPADVLTPQNLLCVSEPGRVSRRLSKEGVLSSGEEILQRCLVPGSIRRS